MTRCRGGSARFASSTRSSSPSHRGGDVAPCRCGACSTIGARGSCPRHQRWSVALDGSSPPLGCRLRSSSCIWGWTMSSVGWTASGGTSSSTADGSTGRGRRARPIAFGTTSSWRPAGGSSGSRGRTSALARRPWWRRSAPRSSPIGAGPAPRRGAETPIASGPLARRRPKPSHRWLPSNQDCDKFPRRGAARGGAGWVAAGRFSRRRRP